VAAVAKPSAALVEVLRLSERATKFLLVATVVLVLSARRILLILPRVGLVAHQFSGVVVEAVLVAQPAGETLVQQSVQVGEGR
jgi:hypothetical protein